MTAYRTIPRGTFTVFAINARSERVRVTDPGDWAEASQARDRCYPVLRRHGFHTLIRSDRELDGWPVGEPITGLISEIAVAS